MKKILLVAVCTLMATAAQAQSVSGDQSNEKIGYPDQKTGTTGGLNKEGCANCANKHVTDVPLTKNTNPSQKTGAGSSDTTPAKGQGGLND
ncbi:hypothetical protein DOM22_00610 [Bdellovibrio sp. ZAP7]|uniref:hypothetical protein n=1 Tax=Bdellovibrio sp. ZAP7 TaxID=2231053 RepID=UPI0011573D86|nr:hypothetical protein [Bdellovibrio sp. ZAP7]QDK43770.1 hypothetical protein DOM22_00610 [Bdellovibrio sp. ZAP7]